MTRMIYQSGRYLIYNIDTWQIEIQCYIKIRYEKEYKKNKS